MIDVHVHLAALPDRGNGCYISAKMLRRPLSRFVMWKFGIDFRNPTEANAFYVERLLRELERATLVEKAVLLALDGVYDAGGNLDMARTDFLISNAYALEVASKHPDHFLAGASVNPQRRDALDELERAVAGGAALVKILPNAQCFDPAESRYLPFYRALARLKLPLLSHVGYEFSLAGRDQSAGDPARLRNALEAGVTVIGAHGCSEGLFGYEPHLKTVREFVSRYPHFYLDASALTLPNRADMLFILKRHPEIQERLLFGTDYPLPVFAYPSIGHGYSDAARANYFDRQALVLKNLGISFRDLAAVKP
ncbi:MAG TPA: amidohydrolase family protein [Candidatus Binatia bacterium]